MLGAKALLKLDGTSCKRAAGKGVALLGGIIKAVFLFGFCFVILYPVFNMIMKTVMDKGDLLDNTVIFIPKDFTFENIKAAAITLNYGKALANTVAITLSTTGFQVLSCMMVGYGFARHEFKGRSILFSLVIFTAMIPPQLLEIPYFKAFRFFNPLGIPAALSGEPFNLIDSYLPFWLLGITCMGIKNGIFIYLFRQSFKNLPVELEEAGTIDGCNSIRIFFRIMIPNITTMLVTVLLFSVVWQYNDVTFTRTFFVSNPHFSTAYRNLYNITDHVKELLGYARDDVRLTIYYPLLKSAGTCIMMAPLIVFYLVGQKFFVQGVERSGIVG